MFNSVEIIQLPCTILHLTDTVTHDILYSRCSMTECLIGVVVTGILLVATRKIPVLFVAVLIAGLMYVGANWP